MRRLDILPELQEQARERWADKRRNPKTGRITSSEIAESVEMSAVLESAPPDCKFCKKVPARVHKRTGELRPCIPCTSRDYAMRAKYPGMTLRKFYYLVSLQQGKCAVCLAEEPHNLVVDTDLGHVRGLVCKGCMDLLDLVDGNAGLLVKAAKYLNNNTFISR